MNTTADLAFLEELALSYMEEYGLLDEGWKLKWDTAKNRAGVCNFTRKVIGLSKFVATYRPFEETEDTILHEIAHALVGPRAGHGPIWKAKAAEIGARPEACFDPGDDLPKGKYEAVCPACGKRELAYRWRLKEAMRGARHTPCGTTVEWIEIAA